MALTVRRVRERWGRVRESERVGVREREREERERREELNVQFIEDGREGERVSRVLHGCH
jgi:hypothetical protein